ncbi:MAG: hypothetical protein JO080_09490 [Mucilaginibacter sp.]|nr:hypothetical protein [Mucilaginibacter sp.]
MVRISLLVFLLTLLISVSVKAQYNFKKYEHGYYYDNSGVKHTGIIHFRTGGSLITKFDFQTDSLSRSQKIGISDIQSIVVTHRACAEDSIWGISTKDSLVALSWRKDKQLEKYVTTLQGIKIFGMVFNSSSGPFNAREYYTATDYDFVENNAILDYHDDESVNWKDFYSKRFSNYPDVVQVIQQIKKKEPSVDDMAAIVKYITHHYPLQ